MSPQRRHPSRPDEMPAPESVYRELWAHDTRLDTLEEKIDAVATDLGASVREAVREIKSSNSSETRKLIAAIAGAAITTIGGVFGAARLERPTPPVAIQRSALDVRLDSCRAMGPGQSREDCFTRVMAETEH